MAAKGHWRDVTNQTSNQRKEWKKWKRRREGRKRKWEKKRWERRNEVILGDPDVGSFFSLGFVPLIIFCVFSLCFLYIFFVFFVCNWCLNPSFTMFFLLLFSLFFPFYYCSSFPLSLLWILSLLLLFFPFFFWFYFIGKVVLTPQGFSCACVCVLHIYS